MNKKIGDIALVTKLAGFEHTKYIQGHCTHDKKADDDVPLFIGKTVREGEINTDFDWYISKSTSDLLKRSKLTKKCLVLPYVGTLGDLAIFDASYPAHLGSNIAKVEIIDRSSYTEEFLYYFLKSPSGQQSLLRDVQGGVQKNITMEAIRNVELPSIAPDKQNLIVTILKQLDRKIANNRKIINELESTARLVYNYWFVQFDFPDEDGKPYCSSGGKMIWNDDLKRKIPVDWQAGALGNLCQFSEDSVAAETLSALSYVSLDNMLPDFGGIVASDYCPTHGTCKAYCEGDILFGNIRPYFKKVHYACKAGGCSPDVLVIRPINNASCFIYETIARDDFVNYVVAGSKGTKMPRGDKDHIMRFPLAIPPCSLITKFEMVVTKMRANIYHASAENLELAELRDWLLPMLISGQITVGEQE